MKKFLNQTGKPLIILSAVMAGSCTSSPPPPPPQPTFSVHFNTPIDLVQYRASFPAANPSGAHTRSRLSTECPNCWTNVRIEAYASAKNWGAENFPNTPGGVYPIGTITNLGNFPTVMYSLKPSTEADYRILITNENGVPGWAIVESSKIALFGAVTVKAKGKLKGCHHAKKPKSEADFRNCDYEGSARSPMNLASTSGLDIIARFMSNERKKSMTLEDPGWISCTEGCCTLSME